MPGLTRRFSFSRNNVGVASPSTPSYTETKCEVPSVKQKTRPQGPRSRRSSILKRTASFPAATVNFITRSKRQDDGNRGRTSVFDEQGGLRSALGMAKLPDARKAPDMSAPPSVVCPGLTTFITAMSVCTSTRAILSSDGGGNFYAGKSVNGLAALTPCASVMAMYSGRMGGFGYSNVSLFPQHVDAEQNQHSRVRALDVRVATSPPEYGQWSYFLKRWGFGISLPTSRNRETISRIEQPNCGRVSPWLTTFQILLIMLLTISLYRNMEILLG
ncbi:hypothetical protein D9756_008199 [Leucocoprinus leucothites]|uniref:Uncharacterized protein n=1 Tax=Leucocoprinus leucothites TaxID=201217 RepID=A0A8H5FW83_9AGAR|nr:hypothetical protein D9756_008199 [Leucoagaricus leucothites]